MHKTNVWKVNKAKCFSRPIYFFFILEQEIPITITPLIPNDIFFIKELFFIPELMI